MINERFSRTELIYGKAAMERLSASRVAVFGVGGVGGYVVEALARSGIGALELIDNDKVCLSNINRQIIATEKTIGRYKVDAAAERIRDISPECEVRTYRTFFLPENREEFDFGRYDYVVDAIDTVTGKLAIIECAKAAKTAVISSMGAGNKTDASAFRVADIYETSVCPLAKVMRRECRKRGIDSLKVVYSEEKPKQPASSLVIDDRGEEKPREEAGEDTVIRRAVPGSSAFVPAVCGLIIAGEIINDLAAI
ncbi:MAG: tRNA threonylcarbamoyladenosine dehydratase, partial [Lachnospiraceae bacterium]|nr:tRNA threonylcarbamoyladenosine dehydratase [Lachnospiraceae bacterium]